MPNHFTQFQRAKVSSFFNQENNYKKHMNNLLKTRDGLLTIMSTRPDLQEAIRPQFDTLSSLIDSILPMSPADYPYPPYPDVVQDISDPDYNGWNVVVCSN